MSHSGQSHLKTITRARPVSLKPPIQHLLCIGAWTRRLFNSLFFWRLNNSKLQTAHTNSSCLESSYDESLQLAVFSIGGRRRLDISTSNASKSMVRVLVVQLTGPWRIEFCQSRLNWLSPCQADAFVLNAHSDWVLFVFYLMSLVKFVTDRSLDRVDRNCFLKQNMFLVVLDINRGQRVLFSVKASDTSSQ